MPKKTKTFCKMEFVRDQEGHELLLKEGRFQVMMEWERPYMEACIDALEPEGDVLEVGFGCGYSATQIQKYPIRSHTIIEYHPLVAKKARAWAKDYPNVKIIEDTWQNALPKLKLFDTIFFDDYPLESGAETAAMERAGNEANAILKMGKKKMREVEEKLSFLQDIRYSDEDIEAFFALQKKETFVDPKVFLRFFFDLAEKKNITALQLKKVMRRLVQEKQLSDLDVKRYAKERKTGASSHLNAAKIRGDRLFEFLDHCLKKHMRKGARFSCYLNDPTSKFEDEKFFNLIITNHNLDYKEKTIPIRVPKHCSYYTADSALVITITKLV